MILDTSALIAVLFGEPEAEAFTRLIHDADRCLISAGSFLELSIVIERRPDRTPHASATCFSGGQALSSSLSLRSRRTSLAKLSTISEKGVTGRV